MDEFRRCRTARRRMLALGLLLALLVGGQTASVPRTRAGAPAGGHARAAGVASTEATWQSGRVILQLLPGTRLLVGADGTITGADPGLATALAATHLDHAVALDAAAGLFRLTGSGTPVDVPAAVTALGQAPGVAYAEPDYRLHASIIPNDPYYSRQWYLQTIRASAAWDMTTGSRSVIVAMLDTGVASNHPELAGKLVPGYNFVDSTTNTSDDNGHGTYTAGLVGALTSNGAGIAGVAWGVRIMPVKILDQDGAGNISDFALGIHWAVDHGARILNISAGIEAASISMHDAVRWARNQGAVVIASSGNTPDGAPRYPAGFAEAVAVAATDPQDHIAEFSSYGSYVDLSAPGVDILSIGWSGGRIGYDTASGTSSAAPIVAGAAALLLSLRPNLTASEIQQYLEQGADDLGPPGWDAHYGTGRLNIARSLILAGGVPPTAVPPTPVPTAVPPTPVPVATTPRPAASLTLSPAHAFPGAQVTLTGRGYTPGEAVGLRMTGPEGRNHELGTAMVAGDSTFSQPVTIPADLGPGTGTVLAQGAVSNAVAMAPLALDAAATPAPPTPAPSTPAPVTGSRIEGTISGVAPDQVQIYLQLGNGVRESRYGTAAGGFYHFDNLAPGTYTVGVSAQDGSAVPPPVTVEVDGRPGTVRVVNFTLDADLTPPTPEVPTADPAAAFVAVVDPGRAGVTFFPPVGHTLRGPFLSYWQAHGGLPVFGYPISEEFVEVSATDGRAYRVQYFQRNRFEYHPEKAGTPYAVLLGLLGRTVTAGRSFDPAAITISDAGHVYFPQTSHRLGGSFLTYWQAHGALPIFGYPISEEISENGYTVQYFERNRFEYHPEYAGTPSEVLLGLLGVDVARAQQRIP
ncbi:MAG TPA: S8 family serine peptidase [Chloroflexia bacterium]|nr:S8 family serine peptidase [Chloroflexia bacterium]